VVLASPGVRALPFALLLFVLSTAPLPAQPSEVLVDRIVAVVDDVPILASDVRRLIELGLAQPREGEGRRPFERRVLDDLIDQRLRLAEVDRFGTSRVSDEEIERAIARIRVAFRSAYREAPAAGTPRAPGAGEDYLSMSDEDIEHAIEKIRVAFRRRAVS